MPRVEADLEAIKQFRQALLDFAGRMREILPEVDAAIAQASDRLEWAENQARQEVRALTNELHACYAAAAQGFPVYCGDIQSALWEAQQRRGKREQVSAGVPRLRGDWPCCYRS